MAIRFKSFTSGVATFNTPDTEALVELSLPTSVEDYGAQITSIRLMPPVNELVQVGFIMGIGRRGEVLSTYADGTIQTDSGVLYTAVLNENGQYEAYPNIDLVMVSDADLYLSVTGYIGTMGYRVYYESVRLSNTQRLELLTKGF